MKSKKGIAIIRHMLPKTSSGSPENQERESAVLRKHFEEHAALIQKYVVVLAVAPYGLWKHGRAGGWCSLENGLSHGTREQAERAKLVFDHERPELTYTVEEFDPAREPEAHVEHVTHAMLDCIEAVARGEDPYLPRALGGKFSRGTVAKLFDQGLIMHDPLKVCAYRVTTAGRRALEARTPK